MEKVKEKEKALNFCLESINLKAFFIKVKEMVLEFKLWILDLFTLDSGLMDSSKVKEKKSNEIPVVAASEVGIVQTENLFSGL